MFGKLSLKLGFFTYNRKLSIFVIFLAAVSAQDEIEDYPVQCTFALNFRGYTCVLRNLELVFPNINIVFEGEHLDNRTDDDVLDVEFQDSMVTFIIPSMFTQFPNLRYLEYYRTSLSYLTFPNITNNLREILIYDGMINRIENETFIYSPDLIRLDIRRSQVREIDEFAFAGLDNLLTLMLVGNQITEIPRRALHDIPRATWIDFERNNLTRIHAESFAESRALRNLYLEYNQITHVEGTFTEAFLENIFIINMYNNLCASRSFVCILNSLLHSWLGLVTPSKLPPT